MVAPRRSHHQRESIVLTELEKSFPNFTGQNLTWVKVPDRQDPPDFISQGTSGPIGLELVNWLDGSQMGAAKTRESRRESVQSLLMEGWESQFKPQHFRAAFPELIGIERIPLKHQSRLRDEFFDCAEEVDRNWDSIKENWEERYFQMEFEGYPTLTRYFRSINYVAGPVGDECWVCQDGDGGAFDQYAVVRSLEGAFKSKAAKYSAPEKQQHLKAHSLVELDLLVHGDNDTEIYNTPVGHLSLAEISQLAADTYASLADRDSFKHVWFFHRVDTEDELNQAFGFEPGEGRVRWLAQLWPEFKVYPGSISG